MADNSKGSLSNLIARARAAQEPEDALPTQPAAEPKAKARPKPKGKTAGSAPKKATTPKSKPKAASPKPAAAPEKAPVTSAPPLAPDRRKGRRGNPDYRQANAYIPKTLHMRVKRALLDEGDREFSSLVEELLEQWLESKGL